MPKTQAEPVAAPDLDETIRQSIEEFKKSVEDETSKADEPAVASEDEAADDTSTQESAKAPDESAEEGGAEEEELLPQEEYDKLKDRPDELRRKLQAAFTKKTQKLAAKRKEVEAKEQQIAMYKSLIEALESDPANTLKRLAGAYGIELKDEGEPEAEEASQPRRAKSRAVEIVKSHLPDELKDWAEYLAPALEELAKETVAEHIQPLKAETEAREAARSVQEALAAFEKKHPDWRKHEARMNELSYKYIAGPNVSTVEYLEFLYELATRDVKKASAVKQVADKMRRAVEKSETPTGGAPSGTVRAPLKQAPTLEEAFQMALKGERVEE